MTSSSSQKILIIEGDKAFGASLAELLRRGGYSVFNVTTGAEGMTSMYDVLPHLILLDIALPDTDGYAILAKKQAEPLLAKIPVFLLSTQGAPINMRSVPQGTVAEFIMAFQANPADITAKVNERFKHGSSAAGASPAGEGKASSASAEGPTVVWVEDDKLISAILSKKFISSGFHLIQAKDGAEALEKLKTVIPDAIVLDLLMPGMSGFEVLQKIKMDKRLDKVPSMVLSNLSRPSDIEKAKMLGAQKFIVKAAASLDQIVAEVRDLCKTVKNPKVLLVSK